MKVVDRLTNTRLDFRGTPNPFRWFGIVIALVVLAALPNVASATPVCTGGGSGYVCYSDVFGPTTGNFSQGIDLPQFNAALGTLTRVEVWLDGQVYGWAQIDNWNEAPPPDGTVSYLNLFANTSLTGAGFSSIVIEPVFQTGEFLIAAGGTVQKSGTSAPLTNAAILTTEDAMAPYIGSGTIPFTISVTARNEFSADQDINLTRNRTTTSGNATVFYYYYTVPEPTTVILIGSSLMGLALIGRKRFVK